MIDRDGTRDRKHARAFARTAVALARYLHRAEDGELAIPNWRLAISRRWFTRLRTIEREM